MVDGPSIEAFAQAEKRWKRRGLFYTSLSVGTLLSIFTIINLQEGNLTSALTTLVGIPVAGLTMYGCRIDPMPEWIHRPILYYLLVMICYMLALNAQQSAPLMWLIAAPALCMFCLGVRTGVLVSFCLLLIILAALLFNAHILTPAYSIRFVCAYLLLTSVCYAYEHNRELATKQLLEAQARIRTLEELLPICAWCKKICNDDGQWENMESYLSDHVQAGITHGVCPDCQNNLHNRGDSSE